MASTINLEEQVDSLKQSNDDLRRSNDDLRRSNDDLRRSNDDLRRSNDDLRQSNDDLRQSNDDLRQSNDDLRQSNDSLENISVERDSAKAQSQHDAMLRRHMSRIALRLAFVAGQAAEDNRRLQGELTDARQQHQNSLREHTTLFDQAQSDVDRWYNLCIENVNTLEQELMQARLDANDQASSMTLLQDQVLLHQAHTRAAEHESWGFAASEQQAQQAVEGRESELSRLRASLHDEQARRDEELEKLHSSLADKDGELGSLQSTIAGKNDQLKDLGSSIDIKDAQIATLQRELAQMKASGDCTHNALRDDLHRTLKELDEEKAHNIANTIRVEQLQNELAEEKGASRATALQAEVRPLGIQLNNQTHEKDQIIYMRNENDRLHADCEIQAFENQELRSELQHTQNRMGTGRNSQPVFLVGDSMHEPSTIEETPAPPKEPTVLGKRARGRMSDIDEEPAATRQRTGQKPT